MPFVVEQALPILKDFKHMVLVGAKAPVAFFAYPGKPSLLGRKAARSTLDLERREFGRRAGGAGLRARRQAVRRQPQAGRAGKPTGALTHASIAQAIAMAMPENAIVVDESMTTGRGFFRRRGAPPHDWLHNMGGSIGFSTPVATGAAVACPDRKVICMVGDGSAMYTLQSLWTQAREGLDVTRSYSPTASTNPARRTRRRRRGQSRPARPGHADARSPDARFHRARQGHGRSGPRGDHGR